MVWVFSFFFETFQYMHVFGPLFKKWQSLVENLYLKMKPLDKHFDLYVTIFPLKGNEAT